MNRFRLATKLAGLSILIFANFTNLYSQSSSIYRLPVGTNLKVKLELELSSKVASVNDTFLTRVVDPILVDDIVVVPAGTVVEGRVTEAVSAAAGGRNGSLKLVFESIRFMNTNQSIDGVLLTAMKPERNGIFGLLSILGGTAAGAAIGAASGSTAVGTAVGLGAGSGVAFLRKGKEVRLQKGQELEIKLKKEVVLPVLEY